MNAKEKASDLINKFKPYMYPFGPGSAYLIGDREGNSVNEDAKKCATIAVEEMIETCNKFYSKLSFPAEVKSDMGYVHLKKELDYLNEVKNEINNTQNQFTL